ncbi:MAG TPA: sigma-70 family RNA polymerase sigma factor [Puia sp.]
MEREKYTRLTDEQALLQRTADGDREAFSILYTHYYTGLYRFVFFILRSPEDSEEIVQDVFLTIWVKRQTLTGIRSFDDYLFRMARNRVFDSSKKSRTRRKLNRHVAPNSEEGANSPFDDLLFQQYHEAAQEAIGKLSGRRREIFLMNARDELTAREIAVILNISLPAVKKQLHEARHFIKEHLRKNAGWLLFFIIGGILFLSQ